MATIEERVGRNEAIFREVNERIVETNDELDLSRLSIVCECAEASCAEQIRIDQVDYRRAREQAAVFIVVPDHVLPAVEDVVFAGEGFVFVRKRGEAAEAAEQAFSQ